MSSSSSSVLVPPRANGVGGDSGPSASLRFGRDNAAVESWGDSGILHPVPNTPTTPNVETDEFVRSRSAPPLSTVVSGNSLFSFDMSDLTEEDKAARKDPNYFYYYHNQKRLNPRLPKPLYNGIGQFAATTGHIVPPKHGLSLKTPVPAKVGCIGSNKSLLDKIQEDFPRTASPIYEPHQQFFAPTSPLSSSSSSLTSGKPSSKAQTVSPDNKVSTGSSAAKNIDVDHKSSSSSDTAKPQITKRFDKGAKIAYASSKKGAGSAAGRAPFSAGLEGAMSSMHITPGTAAPYSVPHRYAKSGVNLSSGAYHSSTLPSSYTTFSGGVVGSDDHSAFGTHPLSSAGGKPAYGAQSTGIIGRAGGGDASSTHRISQHSDGRHHHHHHLPSHHLHHPTNANAAAYVPDPNVYAAQMAAAAASAQYFSQLAANMNMMQHHRHAMRTGGIPANGGRGGAPMHHGYHHQGMGNPAFMMTAPHHPMYSHDSGASRPPFVPATGSGRAMDMGGDFDRRRYPRSSRGGRRGGKSGGGHHDGANYGNHRNNQHFRNVNGRSGGGRRGGSNLEFDEHAKLEDFQGKMFDLSRDQVGSRFLQQKIVQGSDTQKRVIFEELRPHLRALMRDVFGNYVIQKLLRHGLRDHVDEIALSMRTRVLDLSLDTYGCRVVQTAFQVVSKRVRCELSRELRSHVKRCVKDQNGNHVIQKCIENVESPERDFLIDTFVGEVYDFATHPYGCRVIQRILEYCSNMPQTKALMKEIEKASEALMQDQYGNYVIQHVIQHGNVEERAALIDRVRGNMLRFSQHKFASNVVECCLKYGSLKQRKDLVDEILKKDDSGISPLEIMIKDPYANYVVQKIIDIVDTAQRAAVTRHIKAQAQHLKRYTYGKHIISKIEKLPTAEEAFVE